MNKNYRQGAEDVAGAAKKGFDAVGDEAKGMGKQFEENAKAQHKMNEDLINAIKDIAFGFSANGNARNTMSHEGKTLLISALKYIKSAAVLLSEDANAYYDYFYTILDVEPLLKSQFDPEKLEYLGRRDAEYMLYILLEYKAFLTDKVALRIVGDIISNLNISPKRREVFEQSSSRY